MLKDTTLTAGIDTGKDTLDVAVHGTESRFKVDNTKAGWQRLAAELAKAGVGRIGIEATGGYERDVTRQLQDQGFTVLVLQPLQVRAFARLHLCRAKTDRLDAILIAACTHVLKPQARTPDPRLDALVDRLTFIEQVEADIVRLKTRLEHIHDPRLREIVSGDIKTLRARRTDELRRLLKAVREHADLAKRLKLVLSVPGIGERTALALILRMPELGHISREQAAALAGLAPFVQQSGHRQAHIAGGRKRLRRSLYAATLAAAFRWNPALKALYERLTQRGKAHTVALVACARKILVFANAVLARDTPWTEKRPVLNGCYGRTIADPRDPGSTVHPLADIIRFRMLMIPAGYEDGNDATGLRTDPLFKLALERLPSDRDLCSQSIISRLENLPDVRTLLRLLDHGFEVYHAEPVVDGIGERHDYGKGIDRGRSHGIQPSTDKGHPCCQKEAPVTAAPDVEGSGEGGSVLVGGDVIAAEREEVVDRRVRCQESLRRPRDLNRFIWRSRRRVGWCEFSAWLLSPLCRRCSTAGRRSFVTVPSVYALPGTWSC